MAHIVEFSITGLAGRDDVYARTLHRNVNVFFGLNGRGKTSLLRILDSAMSGDAGRLVRVPFTEARVTMRAADGSREHTRTLEKPADVHRRGLARVRRIEESGVIRYGRIAGDVEADEALPFQWTSVPPMPEGGARRLPHRYLPTSRLYWYRERMPLLPDGGRVTGRLADDVLDAAYASSVNDTWRRYSMELLSAIRQAQEAGLAGILGTVLGSGDGPLADAPTGNGRDPQQAYDMVGAFLERQGSPHLLGSREQFVSKYRSDAALQRVVADIELVEQRIEQAGAPRKRLEGLIGSLFSSAADVRFSDGAIEVESRAGESIGLASLSSGEKHMLRLLVEALLAGDSVLLIDEPELSLHVDWQRGLIAAMRELNPDAQYILATHSPEIMADVPDECIFRM